jgi:hypothetical protein
MCLADDGTLSPQPWPTEIVMDYEAYVRWTESVGRSDFNNCIRRSTFDRVRLPDGRAYEALYHLDFAKAFNTLTIEACVAAVHADAVDRSTKLDIGARMEKYLRDAPAAVGAFGELLDRHSDGLQSWAPNRYAMFCRARMTSRMLSGEYFEPLREMLAHISRNPFCLNAWMILVLGSFGSRGVALGRALRTKWTP